MTVHAPRPLLPGTLTWVGGLPLGHPRSAAPRGTLVVMPDLTGTVLHARPLVAALGDLVACVGARPDRGLVAAMDRVTVPELGRRFAADLIEADLPRPLHVLGFSFAGLVAFEAARHLAAGGEDLGGLWILDTLVMRKLPGYRPLRQPLAEARWALSFLWHNRRAALGRRDPDVLHRYGHVRLDLSSFPASYRAVPRGLYRAMVDHRPEPWPEGRAVLVRTDREPYNRGAPPDLGWRRLVPSCEVVHVAGDHPSLLRNADSAAQVARALRDRLAPDVGRDPRRPP